MPAQHVTAFKKASGHVSSVGSPTDISNFESSGTVILDDENDSVTVAPFTEDDDSSNESEFSDQIPNNATVHGIEVKVGAVHTFNNSFNNSSALITKFEVLRATSGLNALSNTFAETGTAFIYDNSLALSFYDGSGLGTDPANFNVVFGGANNLLGLSSLDYDQYNALGLKITFTSEPVSGVDSRIASRLFSHSNGPSPAIRLHYSTPFIGKLHVIDRSKFHVTSRAKLSIT
jgi:hypothetical protein